VTVTSSLESRESIFREKLPAYPKIRSECPLQLPLDPSQQTRISVDRQQQRPVTPVPHGHGIRLGIDCSWGYMDARCAAEQVH
jgi:hypothetical protein